MNNLNKYLESTECKYWPDYVYVVNVMIEWIEWQGDLL